MFGPVETADGYVMLAIASEKTFQSLIKVIGHPEWIADPRFARYSDRRDNWGDLMDGVEAWSRTLTTEKCLAELNGHGVPCSAYRTVAEALNDPQIAHRGALSEVEDGGGTFKVLEPAVPHVRRHGLRGKADGDLGRAHGCASAGDRPFGGRNRRLLRQAAGGGAALTASARRDQALRLFIRRPLRGLAAAMRFQPI